MNEDEKQDKIPEVWEGHNIADYIDPEIMRVSFFISKYKMAVFIVNLLFIQSLMCWRSGTFRLF